MSQRLDPQLLQKLAEKIGKSVKYTREQNAKRASRAGVSSEAYFLHWLKEKKIGESVVESHNALTDLVSLSSFKVEKIKSR